MLALLSPLERKREEREDRDGRENGETTLRNHISGGMAKKKVWPRNKQASVSNSMFKFGKAGHGLRVFWVASKD